MQVLLRIRFILIFMLTLLLMLMPILMLVPINTPANANAHTLMAANDILLPMLVLTWIMMKTQVNISSSTNINAYIKADMTMTTRVLILAFILLRIPNNHIHIGIKMYSNTTIKRYMHILMYNIIHMVI